MSDARNPLEENGEEEMEKEEYDLYREEGENTQQEPEEGDRAARRGSQGQEEGEKRRKGMGRRVGAVLEETDEEIGTAPEEAARDPEQDARDSEEDAGDPEEDASDLEESAGEPQAPETTISLENVLASSQSILAETSLETLSSSKEKSQLDGSDTHVPLGDLSSSVEFLGVDQVHSEEQQLDSSDSRPTRKRPTRKRPIRKRPTGKHDVRPSQATPGLLLQERRDSAPWQSESEKRLSYFPSEEDEKEFQPKADVSKESLVSTSSEDTLFQKDEGTTVYPLSMTWWFGWNSSLPVYYLREEKHQVLLYVCAHTAIIYDVGRNAQHHLQGHPNVISCLCVSEDRRWIATADKGPGCLIIIWDSFTGIPVHTIFDSCPEGNGIRVIAMTRDARYLATISDAEVQRVCIWKWTLAASTPACLLELPKEYGFQNYLTFNPTNNKELVSNSKTQTIYYVWNEEKNILVHSAPLLTEKTFNKLVGKFSQSIFHLNFTQILSATKEGKLVVWDVHRPLLSSSSLDSPYIKPCKLVHLQKESITVLTTVDSYIVTGDVKGNIKFYDHTLAIVNWYSQFNLSCIRSLSFSKTPASPPTENSNFPPDCTLKGDPFIVRNFVIATSEAMVYHLTTDGTKLEKLFVEPKDAVCAISCHPYQPLLAIGSVCGMIKVWDYEQKKYLFSRVFEKGLGIQSLTYNPEGVLLGAGFTEGTVYILDAMSLKSESPEPFKYSRGSVTHVSFSHDSQYMATADVNFTVAVYMVVVKNGQRVWEYLARLRSHRKSIRSLLFGVFLDSNESRLLSLGADALLIEYSLSTSYKDHLEVLDIHRTDQGNHPTCMVWYPPLTKELFLLICNTGYKVKLFNSTTKMCRKTFLGPAYGSPIEQTQVLPVKSTVDLQKRHLVFINRDKVGLQILPVDGNPHKTCAIVCHPSGVAGMALSYDGRYAFTAGGHDRSVVQWKINLRALEAMVSLGGEGLTPFYGLVAGGREGTFYRELEDYFYYSQLRSQGIDTMETRTVSDHIRLSELPFVMRAIGFYPSEEKIEDMFNEIKFSEYMDTGKLIDKINLPDFLKVYLNHRPPFGNTMGAIHKSFSVLGFTNSQGKKAIRREDFLKLLLTKGEHMTEEEMTDCFATLCGLNPEGWKSEPAASAGPGSEICLEEELPDEITAEIFATDILGLTISEDPKDPKAPGVAQLALRPSDKPQ
ncbi:cilia- and flagella-associated protein 251 [Ctenodactylus gundi]